MPRRVHNGPCAFCGEIADLTREHVVPRALFDPQPSDPITVWSCKHCNNVVKSRYDHALRDYLTADAWGSNHPVARRIFEGPVTRAAIRNQAPLLDLRKVHFKPEGVFGKSGLFLGDMHTATVDGEFIQGAMKYLVRGLHAARTGLPLKSGLTYEPMRYLPDSWHHITDLLRQCPFEPPTTVGEVFWSTRHIHSVEPHMSLWVAVFYDRVPFTVWVTEGDVEDVEAG